MAVGLTGKELLRADKLWPKDVFLTKFKNKSKFKVKNSLHVTLVPPFRGPGSVKDLEQAFKKGDNKALKKVLAI